MTSSSPIAPYIHHIQRVLNHCSHRSTKRAENGLALERNHHLTLVVATSYSSDNVNLFLSWLQPTVVRLIPREAIFPTLSKTRHAYDSSRCLSLKKQKTECCSPFRIRRDHVATRNWRGSLVTVVALPLGRATAYTRTSRPEALLS